MANHVMPTYARSDLQFDRGEGPWLFTPDGDRYLDFGSGIAVNALGHAHPALTEALTDQAGKLWHTSNLYNIEGQQALSDLLCDNSFADLVFFTNSGAEACECAIKTARKYHSVTQPKGDTPRWRIITFEGAFHGRTLATIAAGGQAKHLDGFGPKVEGFDQVPLNDVEALKAAITDETAAIMLEPIQGEGGIRSADLSFMRTIRSLCDQHGLLMIVDEVQTGIGRTGKLFAYEWADIQPDIMALAKGIGGGFPLGACLATSDAAQGMTAGSHGSTYGGNQLAMAVGKALMTEVTAPGFIDNVQRLATLFKQKLAGLADAHPDIIEDVRGEGLLLGIKCKVEAADLVAALRNQNMLTVGAGDNVVRLLPPLNIEEDVLDQAISALEVACSDLSAELNKKETGGS